ncbi:hypothetical protein OOJ91_25310 [Micromonospora lupini]|uniref:hypothetical protein n=1 Tax=Micromonospora lupini TaxID=285679 RepID=UPI002251F543|nr:hypothetical protein [Micromonospora lupini]MCX5069166.1 hypothetical protein [Micromonospora lupini]
MNETEREAESVAVGRGTTSRRWLLLAVPAVVLMLAALVGVVVSRDQNGRALPPAPPGTRGNPGEPREWMTSPPPVTPSGPLPVFAGLTPSKVTDAWVERWPVRVTAKGALHTIEVTLPGTQDHLAAAVGQPSKERRNEVGHVFCMVKLHGAVQRSLLRALVDGCIGPVLGAGERKAVLNWLNGVDFSAPTYEFRRTSGYELLANHNSDENFALILNAR